jgi:hypothetical protein
MPLKKLLYLTVQGVATKTGRVLHEFDALGGLLLILCRPIVNVFGLGTLQFNDFAHGETLPIF